ncbi:tripartite tricarboxylate transporter TctB family protein [Virgibacillus kekensis]|uniref:Tripartite tricarboxylate transporter TctB family protein n=1 Tax=Virgibacillus kekensis TaxID=202261 RepID=A0ABV9DIK8_9BACI
MKDFFTLEMTYSTYHLIFPRIIISILITLGIILLITNLYKRLKAGKLSDWQFKFFSKNYDKLKFYGSIALLIVYTLALQWIGFILASIVFMILITLLYIGNVKKKSIIVSITNSLTTTIVVWYIFGRLFDITLP